MPTNDYSKNIVYLSKEQYQELITNETLTVNGQTITYNDNDIYVTPQAEPITDVKVNGTSVATNGVANVPIAGNGSNGALGVVKANASVYGIEISNGGYVFISRAGSTTIKIGGDGYRPIVPINQHESVFYGLSKVAGVDLANETVTLGTYPDSSKAAIQNLLGITNLISTEESSTATAAHALNSTFMMDGKLHRATAAIAIGDAVEVGTNCEVVKADEVFVKKTDYVSSTNQTAGIVGVTPLWSGVKFGSNGMALLNMPADGLIKQGTDTDRAILIAKQHQGVFYGLAKAAGADEKDSTLPMGQYSDTAKTAIRSMIGAAATSDIPSVPVQDIQVNGTSVVSNGVANIPLAGNNPGLVCFNGTFGIIAGNNSVIATNKPSSGEIKNGTNMYKPIVPQLQHESVFYGLAKAAGDTTQSASSNAVGTYTDNAKASIKAMLGVQDGSTGTVDVTGTTPTITGVENTRYVCGEVTTLNFTPPASGISIVRFTSGTTATVLTLPATVKFPEWFDSSALETNTIYEICITDGVYGAVMTWAL